MLTHYPKPDLKGNHIWPEKLSLPWTGTRTLTSFFVNILSLEMSQAFPGKLKSHHFTYVNQRGQGALPKITQQVIGIQAQDPGPLLSSPMVPLFTVFPQTRIDQSRTGFFVSCFWPCDM